MSAFTEAALEVAKQFTGAMIAASAVGLGKALEGASFEAALDASIEHLADARAKLKYPEFREGP